MTPRALGDGGRFDDKRMSLQLFGVKVLAEDADKLGLVEDTVLCVGSDCVLSGRLKCDLNLQCWRVVGLLKVLRTGRNRRECAAVESSVTDPVLVGRVIGIGSAGVVSGALEIGRFVFTERATCGTAVPTATRDALAWF